MSEGRNFEECMEQIKGLLMQEKQAKAKLKEIQRTKMELVRILSDNKYCKKKLKEVSK